MKRSCVIQSTVTFYSGRNHLIRRELVNRSGNSGARLSNYSQTTSQYSLILVSVVSRFGKVYGCVLDSLTACSTCGLRSVCVTFQIMHLSGSSDAALHSLSVYTLTSLRRCHGDLRLAVRWRFLLMCQSPVCQGLNQDPSGLADTLPF